jgi:pentatricopeptide repeat protein
VFKLEAILKSALYGNGEKVDELYEVFQSLDKDGLKPDTANTN